MFVIGAVASFVVGWTGAMLDAWREYPARGTEERREVQIARGLQLRATRGAEGTRVTVTPCAFEHFALIAAYGAPESVKIVAATTRRVVTTRCPEVL